MRNRILPLAVCTLVVTCLACGESESGEAMEDEGMAAETMGGHEMAEANMALQRQAFEAVQAGNLDALDGLSGPGYMYHGPSGPAMDLAGSKAMVAGYVKAFPDVHFTFEFQTANDDYSVARLTVTGTNTGELMGMAATGKPISVTLINVVRIVDGKIVEEWENFDELGLMRQLGMVPAS